MLFALFEMLWAMYNVEINGREQPLEHANVLCTEYGSIADGTRVWGAEHTLTP